MDVSSEYIKMCSEAEEIQAQRPSTGICSDGLPGDYWGTPTFKDGGLTYDIEILGTVFSKLHFRYPSLVWLPRQDQLQELLGKTPDDCVVKLINLYAGIDKDFTSFEQVWLHLLMFEKYKKKWDGVKWVEMPSE